MKRFKIAIVLSVLAFCGMLFGAFCIFEPYYEPAKQQEFYLAELNSKKDKEIAFVGDSWANRQLMNKNILQAEFEKVFPDSERFDFAISGVGGAKSKNVYYNLFDKPENINESQYYKPVKSIIQQKPKYCIVSVGINDVATKIGKDYYVQNTLLIIRHLLHYGIKPVVLEIPQFDFKKAYESSSFTQKILRKISMIVTKSDLDCLQEYRHELELELYNSKLIDSILFVRHEEWSKDGFKDDRHLFLGDGVHLNDSGYHVLDSVLARKIRDYEDRLP